MAEEIRRSGRATKGQHTKNTDGPDVSTPKRAAKGKKSKTPKHTSVASPPEGEGDDIIRCICGYVEEDEDDDRKMIICDQCGAWQHNECMEITEDDQLLPEQYFCEQCKPGNHTQLLAKVARGEKPWEERAKQKEREEEEKKAKRRKGGKKGKKGRLSLKPEKSEEIRGTSTPAVEMLQDSAVESPTVDKVEAGQKRKMFEGGIEGKFAGNQEPLSKVRKVSSTQNAQDSIPKRKLSGMTAPARQNLKADVLQTELVENISELNNETRKKVAQSIVKLFVDQTSQAQKQGAFKLSPNQNIEDFGSRLGLAVEYALYLNLWGPAANPSDAYTGKLRMILHNVKANSALRDRLLSATLSPDALSKMSSDDMASKELQQMTAEMKKETEKQHMIVQEEGPRIRRTHKGEELVGDDSQTLVGTDSIFASVPTRRRDSEMESSVPKEASPAPMSPRNGTAVELSDSFEQAWAGSPVTAPLVVDTRMPSRPPPGAERKSSSSAFNIQNVWSSLESPGQDKQQVREPAHQETSQQTSGHQESAVVPDDDIDHLLKDEEPEEEPYSPADYNVDPESVWRGKLMMHGVAEVIASGKHVGGANLNPTFPWAQLMPHMLSIEGRIDVDRASEYLCGLRWSKTTDVSVVSVTPAEDPDARIQFDKLFDYFADRKRFGVIGKSQIPAVKDTYVVPLESGMSKKPDFIELLEDSSIEEPRPERMLLITFVIKSSSNHTGSAHATPRHLDSGAPAGSPPGVAGNSFPAPHQTPLPATQPSSYISPIPQQLPPYGSPAQYSPAYSPPPHGYPQPQSYQPQQEEPKDIDAARIVLGEMANSPAIEELLSKAPRIGIGEFGIIKGILEGMPASQTDFGLLTNLLTERLQQQQQQQQQQ